MGEKGKTCIHCKKAMTGRVDKKYCSDHCRASAANVRKQTEQGERWISEINTLLRRNRQLLRKASPQGKTTLRRQVLELSGFSFNYFTHLYQAKNGNTYYFCYDYGYRLLEDGKMLIVNWQQYMANS